MATFVIALTLAVCSRAGAADDLPPMSMDDLISDFYRAVLDWCETRSGNFILGGKSLFGENMENLSDLGSPGCELGPTEVWGGIPGLHVEIPLAFWWGFKAIEGRHNGAVVGILWYVLPTPKKVCADSDGEFCPCRTARAALNNPAKVRVILIGPGAGECGGGGRAPALAPVPRMNPWITVQPAPEIPESR